MGAGARAADPQRRHLQLQRRSVPAPARRRRSITNAPPGFLYPGDAGFVNGKAGMENHWMQFSPRVGFAWDPKGDGRMSVRERLFAGVRLRQRAVPPEHVGGAAVRRRGARRQPGRRLRRPVLGSGQRDVLPVHGRPELAVPADRSLHLDTAGHQDAAAAVVERQRSASDRRQPGRVGDLSRQLHRPSVERPLAESGRLHSRVVHAADADWPAVVRRLLDDGDARTSAAS